MLRLSAVLSVLALAAPAGAQDRCGPGRVGCWRDEAGAWREAETDYEAVHDTPAPDHLRTAVEMTLFLGGGTVWYWLDRERNVADWDYDSWKQRLTLDAFRYDNNEFPVNFVWHPWSGAAYHVFARANDLGLAGAAAWGFATSLAWEFLLEFKERISINDVLVTTGGGVPIGEFFHKLALHLRSSPDAARWVLTTPMRFHDALDGRTHGEGPSPLWHRFRLSYDVASAAADGGARFAVHGVGFDGTIVAIPGYLRAGTFDRFFADADFATFRARATFGDGSGLDLLADTTLLGWYRQAIRPSVDGLHGDSVAVGTSLGFLYRVEEHGAWEDRLSVLGLPGVALDVHVLSGGVRVGLTGRVHAAFAGVNAPLFARWQEANEEQTAKSILRKQGYYYGWGLWARLEGELAAGPISLSGAVSFAAIDSHEGLDRRQDHVTADVGAVDRAVDYEARVRVAPPFARGGYVEVSAGGRARASELGGLERDARITRWGLGLGLAL